MLTRRKQNYQIVQPSQNCYDGFYWIYVLQREFDHLHICCIVAIWIIWRLRLSFDIFLLRLHLLIIVTRFEYLRRASKSAPPIENFRPSFRIHLLVHHGNVAQARCLRTASGLALSSYAPEHLLISETAFPAECVFEEYKGEYT